MDYRLRVHLTGDPRHTPHVLAGLEALEAAGDATITWRARPPRWRDRVLVRDGRATRVGRPYPWMVLIDVLESPSGARGRMAIDLQDWREMHSREALETCAVVFKRMYVADDAAAAERLFPARILPAGLSHAVPMPAIASRSVFRRGKAFQRLESVLNAPRLLLRRRGPHHTPSPGSPAHAAPKAPTLPDDGFAFFQVKYHPWGDGSEAAELNEVRARLIRALRAELGPRFQGGMYFDGEPPAAFADCLTPLPTDRESYLALNERATVVVSTEGFGASPPWKLCEYLQQGRSIVAERMPVVLPDPLEDDVHLRFFDHPEACASLCASLLDAPETRARLEREAAAYYRAHVDPEATIRRHLRQAEGVFAAGPSHGASRA